MGNSVPNRNTVTAVAREPDHLDLFVVGHNGGIYSTWWHQGEAWADWFRIGGEKHHVPNGNTVTAVAREPDHLDLFVVGHNGGIYSTWWHQGEAWADWFRIGGEKHHVPNGNTVTAVAREPDHLDLFVVGHNGGIYSTWWHQGEAWADWFRIGGEKHHVPNGNTVTAVAREPDHLDLFVVGHNGGIYSTWWHQGEAWADWFRIGGEKHHVPNGNTVTAVAREPDHLDLFVVGHNGGIYSTWWHQGEAWADWFRIGGEKHHVPNGNTVTAVAREPDHLDLFVVGHNGGIYSTWWHQGEAWADWFRIGGEKHHVPNGNTVTAVAREPDHLDLFVVGHNGGIYSTWWHQGEAWADWFRIGYKEFLVLHFKSLLPITSAITNFINTQHTAIERLLSQFEIRVYRGTTEDLSGNANLAHLVTLDVGSCLRGQPTQEHNDLFVNRNNAGGTDLVVYIVQALQGGSGNFVGCATHPDGQPGAAIVQSGANWLLAHEVGHVLGLRHVSKTPSTNSDFLMWPNTSWTNVPPDVSSSEVSTMLKSGLTRACSPDRSGW